MKIRVLTAEDASMYRELRKQALALNPESFLTTYNDYIVRPLEQVASQLAPTDHNFTLGAITDAGQLVGTATLIREKAFKISHIASVQAMFVAGEFRRHGIGRMLLMEIIGRASQVAGVEQIKLSVVQDNAATIELCKSLGFRTFGHEAKALKANGRYWDELHMVLHLAGEDQLEGQADAAQWNAGEAGQ